MISLIFVGLAVSFKLPLNQSKAANPNRKALVDECEYVDFSRVPYPLKIQPKIEKCITVPDKFGFMLDYYDIKMRSNQEEEQINNAYISTYQTTYIEAEEGTQLLLYPIAFTLENGQVPTGYNFKVYFVSVPEWQGSIKTKDNLADAYHFYSTGNLKLYFSEDRVDHLIAGGTDDFTCGLVNPPCKTPIENVNYVVAGYENEGSIDVSFEGSEKSLSKVYGEVLELEQNKIYEAPEHPPEESTTLTIIIVVVVVVVVIILIVIVYCCCCKKKHRSDHSSSSS